MPPQPTLNELLHTASRTFALGIDLLRDPLRTEVQTAYLVLRVSDYLEDNESMAPERKADLLERWAAALAEAGTLARAEAPAESAPVAGASVRAERPSPAAGPAFGEAARAFLDSLGTVRGDTPDAQVARHAARVYDAVAKLSPAARAIVAAHTRDSTLGMARWVRRGPEFPDEAALDDYMHEVAGRVGWLLTDLFAERIPAVARHRESMRALGREFGLALQTVNVIRGLHDDWERGWVFVPRTFVPDEAPPLASVLDGSVEADDTARRIVDRLVAKAEHHLDGGEAYLTGLPRREHRTRLFCMFPYLFAVRTLALSRDNPRVFREEVKMSRAEVRHIVRRARWLGWSNRWIGRFRQRLSADGARRSGQQAGVSDPPADHPPARGHTG